MKLFGLLGEGGGKYESVCKAWRVWGHVPPGKFDLLLDAIWWNLGLFLHKHNLPFVSLKLL